MLKEMLLASSVIFNSSNIYNLDNNYVKFSAEISHIDTQSNPVTFVIDLNSGNYYTCFLNITDEEPFTFLTANNIQNQNNNGALNLSSFINYIYSSFGFNSQTIITYSYMDILYDFDINSLVLNDSVYNRQLYMSATLGTPVPSTPNTFYQVCDWWEGDYIEEEYTHTTQSLMFNNFIGHSLDNDLYLILSFHNLYVQPNYPVRFSMNFSFDDLYLELEDVNGFYRDTNALENLYTNFIYDNYYKLQGAYDNLNYDFIQLEGDYDLVRHINDELLAENDRLNSKHALSNTFDIIRSSFNGIVDFLEIELMPNLTIGTIVFIPVVIGVIFFILKALVL